ncbi:MAG: peptidoglycan DD-metalloendopeptidase family protein [Acutalibacteraceae bacterium]
MNLLDNNNQDETLKDDSNPSKNSKKKKIFYVVLTLCVTAISVAGWSTYQSVKNFLKPAGENPTANYSQASKIQKSEKFDKRKILEKKSNDKDLDYNSKNSSEIVSKDIGAKNIEIPGLNESIQPVSTEPVQNLVIYPSSKSIIKEFSGENPVYSKTFSDWRIHRGTDFKAEEGSTVKSISDGKVKDITTDEAYGTTVIIEHSPGFIAYYSGLGETTAVTKDQELKAGDNIGLIKNVPCEILDEPHLHLAICKDEKFIDPMLVLDGAN